MIKKSLLLFLTVTLMLVVIIPAAPVSAQEDGLTRYVYIGPWLWIDSDGDGPRPPRWDWPDGALDVLDLRSNVQLTENTGGLAIWVAEKPLDNRYSLISIDWGDFVNPNVIQAIDSQWSINIDAYTSRGLIWDMFTQRGDPTGETRWRPLQPEHDGTLVIYLNGYSPVEFWKDQPFTGTKKEYKQQVKADKKKNRQIVKTAKKAARKANKGK